MPRAAVETRLNDILDAALVLLREDGLGGVTTNALARRARCSKDTLYALFEDRDAILMALVRRQSAGLNATMVDQAEGADAQERLVRAGAQLYAMLLSETSLAINRAAMADASGQLSRLLIEQGQAVSAPRIRSLISDIFSGKGPDEIGALYMRFYGLLISDRQILALHRVVEAEPSPERCRVAAEEAVRLLVVSAA